MHYFCFAPKNGPATSTCTKSGRSHSRNCTGDCSFGQSKFSCPASPNATAMAAAGSNELLRRV